MSLSLSGGRGLVQPDGDGQKQGTKIFSLVARCATPARLRSHGIRLREVIYDIGGALRTARSSRPFRRGTGGGFLPAEFLDLAIDYDNLVQAGSTMGSADDRPGRDHCMVVWPGNMHFTQESPAENASLPRRDTADARHPAPDNAGEGEEEDLAG